MPTGQYSGAILTGAWPANVPEVWHEAAVALREKSHQLDEEFRTVFMTALHLPNDNAGKAVEAFVESAGESAKMLADQSKLYNNMASAADETGNQLESLQEKLVNIDSAAHKEIQRLIDEARNSRFIGAAAYYTGKIQAVIAEAKAEALFQAETSASEITERMSMLPALDPQEEAFAAGLAQGVGGAPTEAAKEASKPSLDGVPQMAGGIPGRGGASQGMGAPGPKPQTGGPTSAATDANSHQGAPSGTNSAGSSGNGAANAQGSADSAMDSNQHQAPAAGQPHGSTNSQVSGSDQMGQSSVRTDALDPNQHYGPGIAGPSEITANQAGATGVGQPGSMIPSSGGSGLGGLGSGGGSGGGSGLGGLGGGSSPLSSASGMKMPSASGLGGGAGDLASSAGGLTSGGGLGAPGLDAAKGVGGIGAGGGSGSGAGGGAGSGGGSGLGGPGSGGAAGELSRGLGAGLGSAAASSPILPPPSAAGPPSGVPGAGAPLGAPVSGAPLGASSAPVTPSAGAPVSAAPVAPAGTPVPAGPMAMPPMGGAPVSGAGVGGGPLPPFNSDLPKTIASAASTAPAAGPALPTPPAAGPSSNFSGNATVAALPPGVLASGVGAAAGGIAGLKSSEPDPLLAAAEQLTYELAHASRVYGLIDWCVGVFLTPAGPEMVVVSNEGAGYIPPGVFVPRTARMLFCDSGLPSSFRARWFSWANPAQTMLAYAALLAEHSPNFRLQALAVSTGCGGSSMPARDAGVPHYIDCPLARSPIADDAEPAPLDEEHMHRLETLDRALYGRVTGVTGTPDRSESWEATRVAVHTALQRASAVKEVEVPAVLREVLAVLESGERVGDERWDDLEFDAVWPLVLRAGSERPGYVAGPESATPSARAYHSLARAAELLAMWRRPDALPYAEIAYAAAHVMGEAQLFTAVR
jgi:hypothetical protein